MKTKGLNELVVVIIQIDFHMLLISDIQVTSISSDKFVQTHDQNFLLPRNQ